EALEACDSQADRGAPRHDHARARERHATPVLAGAGGPEAGSVLMAAGTGVQSGRRLGMQSRRVARPCPVTRVSDLPVIGISARVAVPCRVSNRPGTRTWRVWRLPRARRGWRGSD